MTTNMSSGPHSISLPRFSEGEKGSYGNASWTDNRDGYNNSVDPRQSPSADGSNRPILTGPGSNHSSILPRFGPGSNLSISNIYAKVGPLDPTIDSSKAYNPTGRVWRKSWYDSNHALDTASTGYQFNELLGVKGGSIPERTSVDGLSDLQESAFPSAPAGTAVTPADVHVTLAANEWSVDNRENARCDDIFTIPSHVKDGYDDVFSKWGSKTPIKLTADLKESTNDAYYKSFYYTKKFAYYGPLLVSGLYLGAAWGALYALYMYLLNWYVRPLLKIILLLTRLIWVITRAVVYTLITPVFEAMAMTQSRMKGQLGVKLTNLNITTPETQDSVSYNPSFISQHGSSILHHPKANSTAPNYKVSGGHNPYDHTS